MNKTPPSSDDPYRVPTARAIEEAGTRTLPYRRVFAACTVGVLATPAMTAIFLWSPVFALPSFVLFAALTVLSIVWIVRGYMSRPGIAHGALLKVLMVTGLLLGLAVSILLGAFASAALLARHPVTTEVALPPRQ